MVGKKAIKRMLVTILPTHELEIKFPTWMGLEHKHSSMRLMSLTGEPLRSFKGLKPEE